MGTHYTGTKEEEFSLDAFIKLMRATETLNYSLNKHLAKKNITASQFGVLEALHHLGPQNQKSLGDKLLKSGGNMTLVIDNLEKQELVKRTQDPDDRRALSITLTEKGKKFINDLFPEHMGIIVEQFNVLTNEEKKQLAGLCKKLGIENAENPKV